MNRQPVLSAQRLTLRSLLALALAMTHLTGHALPGRPGEAQPTVAGAERALAVAYQQALNRAKPEEQQALRQSQLQWHAERNSTADVLAAPDVPPDEAARVLAGITQQRIRELTQTPSQPQRAMQR